MKLAAPNIVDRSAFQAELDALRVREKAHTHEGDAIAAARRRLASAAPGRTHSDGNSPYSPSALRPRLSGPCACQGARSLGEEGSRREDRQLFSIGAESRRGDRKSTRLNSSHLRNS